MNEMENMLSQLLQAVPNIITALLLLLLAWVIAKIVKGIISAVIRKIKLPDFKEQESSNGSRSERNENKDSREQLAVSAGSIGYYLVFILFVPSILDALNMTSVAQPISNMMESLLLFLPNLLLAAIILIVGILIARLVRNLVQSALDTVNFDRFFDKLRSNQVERPDPAKLSTTLANIVMVIVLIPIVIIALEALSIETISEPIVVVLSTIMNIIPSLFVAIILVIAGYYIATFVARLLTGLLNRTNINRVYEAIGFGPREDQKFDLPDVLGKIVQVLIILFFTVQALEVIDLTVLNQIGNAIIIYLPMLISALLIIGLGLVAGNFLEKAIVRYTRSSFSALIVKYTVILFAVFMTLEQLGFASSIVNIAFLLILGGLAVAFAISFGIGGRDFATRQLDKFENRLKKKDHDEES
ncbi:mechanosensitive ion channel [Salicibibacter cibarius]|uniref:Mechanosensitive ion channel n=1 Tax=Salicibibacter cibarius TaxID=2743000 RepID=A0A7T6Z0F4_9BACI|nr:mechanosensitive ion channel [Salicibibacter cibarius]QQK74635.1 mechanosensitive ion channel [Salicibibacter cibarius]